MPTGKTDMDKAILEIRDLLEISKGHLFVEFIKDFKANRTIQPVSNDEEEARELDLSLRIKTNTIIDEMIGGGIGVGESLMLYGEYAAGKTQAIFTFIALCKNYVIIIDTEGTFSFKRIKQICDLRGIDYDALKKRIILYKPINWGEQLFTSRSIPTVDEFQSKYGKDAKVDIIICDSVINYFRGIEFTGRETLPIKTGFLREFLGALKDNALAHKACVIFTDQVSEKPAMTAYTSKADTQCAVGGHSITHYPTYNLFFRKGSGNIRAIRMMDSSNNPLAEEVIVINEKGIDDLPQNTKAAKLYAESTKKFETKQSQETIVPKKKKKSAEEITEEEIEDNSTVEETEEGEE